VHRAANGTLFLDEIGDLPLDVQPKLLRFISELKFQRVGCTRTEDFRGKLVVAATERPRENVRESLRDRFNSFTIPPLRERREEILPMAQSMLAHLNRGRRQPSDLLGEAEHFISEQDWRGNARQLFKTLQKAATAYDEITADVLRECLDAEPSGRSVPPSVDGSKTETPESVRRFEDISPEDLVAHGVKWSDLPKGSSTIVRKVVLVICADALVKQRGLQQKAWAESLGTTAGNLLATISSLKGRVTNGDVTLASLKELLGRIVHEARYEELYAAALTDFVNNAKLTSERQLRPPRRLSSSVLLQP
jgi:DNA-binding NtrC family response regulator